MKVGIRKPSLKRSLKARTTGKWKRKIKKQLIPGYGKKGMGWIKNPKKAAYNKIYRKTTVGVSSFGHNPKWWKYTLLVIFYPVGIVYLIVHLCKRRRRNEKTR